MNADETRAVTGDRLDALQAYLSELSLELDLAEWELHLKLDRRPSTSEAMAEVVTTGGRLVADFRFDEEFFTDTPEHQRHYVTHELLHLHTSAVQTMIDSPSLDDVMGRAASTIYRSATTERLEQAVDRLASVIERHLPLPKI